MSMERAYRMRAAHQEAAQRDAIRDPISDEEMELGKHDKPLADILGNDKEQDLYLNHFLYQKDPTTAKDIVDALSKGTLLTARQNTFLEKNRKEYNLHSASIERVQEHLTPEELTHIAQIDPRIQEIVGQVGEEKVLALIAPELRNFAMSDTKAFNKIVKGMRSLQAVREGEDAKAVGERVQRALEDLGLTEEKFEESTRSGLTADTKKHLSEAVAEQLTGFSKAMNFITMGHTARKGGERLYMNFQDQQRLLAECDTHLKTIGKVLQGTINTDMRTSIQKYMVEGGSLEKIDTTNIKTVGDLKRARDEFDPSILKGRYDQYFKSEQARLLKNAAKGASLTPAQIDGIKDTFAAAEENKHKGYKGSGLMAALLSLLFGRMDKNAIKSMI